jgi:PAS domain S-box
MGPADSFATQLHSHVESDGPTIPTAAVATSLAATLSEMRETAPVSTHGGGDDPALDWATQEIDEAPISIVITGPAYADNPVWYANEAFESLTGYTETEVIGDNLRLLQGSETSADAVADLREAVDIWEATVVELANYRANGDQFRSRVAIAPIPDETGTISNWVGFQEARPTA